MLTNAALEVLSSFLTTNQNKTLPTLQFSGQRNQDIAIKIFQRSLTSEMVTSRILAFGGSLGEESFRCPQLVFIDLIRIYSEHQRVMMFIAGIATKWINE